MKQTSVPTDHWIVATKYAPNSAPFIGKGRWTWQTSSLKSKELVDLLVEKGHTLHKDLWELKVKNTPHELENPQTLWKKFKNDICTIMVKHGKTAGSKIAK